MSKLLWVKFGWSDYYRGGPIDGNFPFIKDGKQGHEAWNFLPQDDGTYYCYTPPQGGSGTPWSNDPYGWTVVCLAKDPARKGLHVVGWYKDAELIGNYAVRPAGFDAGGTAPLDEYYYTIRSSSVWFVPPEFRSKPFSHPSVRQGKYSFLDGPGVEITANKRAVKSILQDRLAFFGDVSIHNPNASNTPDRDNDKIDPLGGFGGPEHRKAVEKAAVQATWRELNRLDYDVVSRESDNIGYDLHAIHRKDGSALHVEVKGTSGSEPRFFMTMNEYGYRLAPEWRLAIAVNALTKPDVRFLTLREVEREFELTPMVWKAIRRILS
ncbi:DUF3883 domain-containing protein [Tritonibacter scottomollicae]|uniref:DUF3883 domain-containing protein n=1 Tax=Tritonibacter scottomollicae TaxID=483013 RepID=UPI003BAD098B